MSAFIVNDYHINALITYGVQNNAQYWTGKEWVYFNEDTAWSLATKLYRANVQSVNSRYKQRTRSTGFKYKPVGVSHLLPADIIRACDCLDYQSCERKEWERSQAKKALIAIREKAIDALAKCSSAWELEEPAEKQPEVVGLMAAAKAMGKLQIINVGGGKA